MLWWYGEDEGPRWHSCRNKFGREQRQSDHAGQKCPSDIDQDTGLELFEVLPKFLGEFERHRSSLL